MHGTEFLIPIFFFLVVGAVWGIALLAKHKERMTMLDKGLSPQDIKTLYERGIMKVNPLASLKWGIIFVSIGLAIMVGIWLEANTLVSKGIFFGLMGVFGGTGLLIFYVIASRKLKSQ
jgi:hypothetical protein